MQKLIQDLVCTLGQLPSISVPLESLLILHVSKSFTPRSHVMSRMKGVLFRKPPLCIELVQLKIIVSANRTWTELMTKRYGLKVACGV